MMFREDFLFAPRENLYVFLSAPTALEGGGLAPVDESEGLG